MTAEFKIKASPIETLNEGTQSESQKRHFDLTDPEKGAVVEADNYLSDGFASIYWQSNCELSELIDQIQQVSTIVQSRHDGITEPEGDAGIFGAIVGLRDESMVGEIKRIPGQQADLNWLQENFALNQVEFVRFNTPVGDFFININRDQEIAILTHINDPEFAKYISSTVSSEVSTEDAQSLLDAVFASN